MSAVCETRMIKIASIKSKRNSRSEFDKDDIANLMNSIKQDGLLQAIGVTKNGKGFETVWGNRRLQACKKLGLKTIECKVVVAKNNKELAILNLIENIQRNDVTVIEQGRYIHELMKAGLTKSEVAARLSIPKNRVHMLYEAFAVVPAKFRSKVYSQATSGGHKKGKIPLTHVAQISSLKRELKLNKKDTNVLYELASSDDFSRAKAQTFGLLVKKGLSKTEALKTVTTSSTVSVRFTISTKEKDKFVRRYKKPFADIVRGILRGKIKEKVKLI